jgi:hypothetical protein
MAEYRAYLIDPDGHFIGYEPLWCANDAEAVETAKQLVRGYDVELSNGPRLVTQSSREEVRLPQLAASFV